MIKYKKLSDNATAPRKAKPGDAGYDLYSAVDIIVPSLPKTVLDFFKKWSFGNAATPLEFLATKINTDIAIELPSDCVGLIWDRSGLGSKLIKVFGGVVDSSYRGNIIICLANFGWSDYVVKKGDRIAQLLIQKVEDHELVEGELSDTERQCGGFGSTGT